jgi:hypothetical protein
MPPLTREQEQVQTARAIRQAVELLNKALDYAPSIGVIVELEVRTIKTIKQYKYTTKDVPVYNVIPTISKYI